MAARNHVYLLVELMIIAIALLEKPALCRARKGRWQLLLNNTGVVAMHMAVTHLNTVIMFDQTGAGPSSYRLRRSFTSGRRCADDSSDESCYAHSIKYDISSNYIRAMRLETDPWCSSGSFLSDGTLLQTGGYGNGSRRIRYFRPCRDGRCDWVQSKTSMSSRRWYASNQKLPENDRVLVVGGRRVFSYEFVPKLSLLDESHDLPFLRQTYDGNGGENNLYPFLHLSSDGNLFIFANRDSILFDYRRHKVVKTFPRMPGKGSRSYPSSGSSVILPLEHGHQFRKVEVMVCGGAAPGAHRAAGRSKFLKGLKSCGRMEITGNKHQWKMENMPGRRLMNDMIILPTGHILIINGARRGSAGWNNAADPSLVPYLYKPEKTLGRRFSTLASTEIARLYHSSASLLPDGRILVAGGNPNQQYMFENVTYPTELRLQAFIPHYMDRRYHKYRPENVTIETRGDLSIKYGEDFTVRFWLGRRPSKVVEFSVYAPPFTTHSLSMNQRLLKLSSKNMVRDATKGWVNVTVKAPPSPNVAPSGYYMLTVVNGGIPSTSQWIRFIRA